mgnify:CR=1 FL=1
MPVLQPEIAPSHDSVPEHDWSRMSTFLTRYARARVGDPEVVADVVQETLVRLVDQLRVQKPVSLYALGFRIAANLLVDHYRHQKRFADEPEVEPVSRNSQLSQHSLYHRRRNL